MWDHMIKGGQSTEEHILKENSPPSPQKPSAVNTFSIKKYGLISHDPFSWKNID